MDIALVIGITALLGCVALGLGVFVLETPHRSSAARQASPATGR
jgi:hypothetical protein